MSFKDWPSGFDDVLAFLERTRYMLGYSDNTFRPYAVTTELQVATVAKRAGIILPSVVPSNRPATMGWVEGNYFPLTVYSAKPDELCTRLRLAIMLYRYLNSQYGVEGAKLDAFMKTRCEKSVIKLTPFYGYGKLFIGLSKELRVPLWLALGQSWKESQWWSVGRYPWGIRRNGEFVVYGDVPTAVKDYYHLMNYGQSGYYRQCIDLQNWDALVERYAPSFENDHESYMKVLYIVKKWISDAGLGD